MGIKQVKVNVNELTLGMFVSGLDRPWTQTPFPLQGFYIRDVDEIHALKTHCRHVFIDVVKGRAPIRPHLRALNGTPSPAGVKERPAPQKQKIVMAPLIVRRDLYQPPKPLRKEIRNARLLHQKVNHAIEEMARQLDRDGEIPVRETQRIASEMVDSVLRNPDAMTWLTRVKEKDEHTYSHSVRSAVWAIIFGRHMGLSKKELNILALGVLLKDVGKTRLDSALLSRAVRTEEEEEVYRKFVDYSVDILRHTDGVPARVLAIVKNHCERINGTGFPLGLIGEKIPVLARIAGIVTFYDDITNPRDAVQPVAPSRAISRLYDMRGHEFQEQLVVEFIRAIGLYPTGTLVELSTGEVAVVVEQNFSRRLKPKVMIVLDAAKQVLTEPTLLDLAEDEREKQALIDSGKKTLEEAGKVDIIRDLEPGSCAVDIRAIRDGYLMDMAKRSIFSLFRRG